MKTEKKNIRSALDKCTGEYEEIRKKSSVAIVVIEKTTHKIVSINPAALNMIGRTEDVVLGQECHGLICPRKRDECPFIDCDQAFDQVESYLLKEDGEHLDIFKTIVPIQIDDNAYIIETIFKKADVDGSINNKEFVNLIPEVLNQTQVKSPVRDYELKDIIRFLPDATFIINKDKQVVAWNRAMEKLSEIPARDVLGKNEYQIPFCTKDQMYLADMVLEGKKLTEDSYISYEWKNGILSAEFFSSHFSGGKRMYLSGIAFPLSDNAGKTIAAVESLRDITRYIETNKKLTGLKENPENQVEQSTEELHALNNHLQNKIKELEKTEKTLMLANKKINLLNSITRHDVLNQLTVIYTYLEIARDSLKNEEIKNDLISAEKAGERINDLISFTHLYRDLGTKPPEWQDVHKCFVSATNGRVPDTISCSSDVEGINLFADPLLEKVFYNLVENTLRHGGNVTEIRLSHQSTNDELVLIFEDNGVGIATEDKEQIFERGYGKNTGFGLFLIREILGVTSMSIIETGEPGKGVRFEIHIPIGK